MEFMSAIEYSCNVITVNVNRRSKNNKALRSKKYLKTISLTFRRKHCGSIMLAPSSHVFNPFLSTIEASLLIFSPQHPLLSGRWPR
jgi:hypothetical protein